MKLSTFAREFGIAYRGEPFTRQYIYLLVKEGKLKAKMNKKTGLLEIPDKIAKEYIKIYSEARAKENNGDV